MQYTQAHTSEKPVKIVTPKWAFIVFSDNTCSLLREMTICERLNRQAKAQTIRRCKTVRRWKAELKTMRHINFEQWTETGPFSLSDNWPSSAFLPGNSSLLGISTCSHSGVCSYSGIHFICHSCGSKVYSPWCQSGSFPSGIVGSEYHCWLRHSAFIQHWHKQDMFPWPSMQRRII